MSTMSTPERSRSIPPPPPPIEDNLSVEYGSMANTYSNNHMADDESVEAQHVVYTFAEEGKSSKKGRKKCVWLMLTSLVLLGVIVALGVVYGTQREDRNSGTISEANSAEANLATSNEVDSSGTGATTTNTPVPNVDLNEDLYDSPNLADSNSTEFGDDTFDVEEDISTENEIFVAANSTNASTPVANGTIPDAGTIAPSTISSGTVSSTFSGTVTTATTSASTSGTSSTGTVGVGGVNQTGANQGGFQGGPNQGGFQGGPNQGGANQGGFQGGANQGGFQGGANQGGFQGGANQGGFQGGANQGGFQGGANQGGFQGGAGQGGFQGGANQGGFQGGPNQGRPNQGRPNQGGFQGGAGQGGFQGGAGQGNFNPPNQVVVNDGSQAIGRDEPIEQDEADNVFGV